MARNRFSTLVAIPLVIMFIVATASAKPAPKELVGKLESFYLSVKSLKSNFTQEIHISGFETVRKSSGTVWFLKPEKMRWDYKKPKNKVVLFDGEYLWMYLPLEYQAYKQRASFAFTSQLPLLFLEGKGSLARDFEVDLLTSSGEAWLLKLTPRKKDSALPKGVEMEVDKKSLLILKVSFFDAQGNLNLFTFSGYEINVDIPEAYFKLDLGPDVQIVE